MEINKIEQELLKLITKAKDKNEVPIAALIVKNDKIISKSYNKVNKSNNILDHAEILVKYVCNLFGNISREIFCSFFVR